jgi:hypothetical protein
MAEESDNFFGPPAEPVEVFCLHCGNVYSSSDMKFVASPDGACRNDGVQGDWMCPAPGCDGIGYGFDVHSVEEWDSHSSDCDDLDDEEFADNPDSAEAYIEEFALNEDDEFVPVEGEAFLPPSSHDPEEAFREIQRDMNWWDAHDFPFARLWRMWVHFRPYIPPETRDDSQRTFERFNEDDIPF